MNNFSPPLTKKTPVSAPTDARVLQNNPTLSKEELRKDSTMKTKQLSNRQARAISALSHRPCFREELDRITGASNSPETIRQLRAKGFNIHCERVKTADQDGITIRVGLYHFINAPKWGVLTHD